MNYYQNCKFCGQHSGKYELCNECYQLSKDEYIIKNEKGEWVKNARKGNEYKFYDENKTYTLKTNLLNKQEMRFFNIIRKALPKKYVIVPQVNLQTIIETDTNTRNDELYRNIDFAVFYTEQYTPFLMIEINGEQHYYNEYWKERDKSVKSILNQVQLPLLTIDVKKLKEVEDKQILTHINKVIKYLNPSFFKKLFCKKINKMDLSWAKELQCH